MAFDALFAVTVFWTNTNTMVPPWQTMATICISWSKNCIVNCGEKTSYRQPVGEQQKAAQDGERGKTRKIATVWAGFWKPGTRW